jgi:DNA replication protein DnaC
MREEQEGQGVQEWREGQVPQAQLPAPQASPQQAQRYHRHTQPLNPAMNEDMSYTQEHTRKIAVNESGQQRLSASVPPPMGSKDVCPKCKGAGYLRIDVPFGHPNFGKPVACECKEAERREKRRQQLLDVSDLSAFQHKSFKNFNTRFSGVHPSVQEAFQVAYKFAQNPDGWLVLIGPNGCGKTHLAAAIANYHFSQGAVVLFTVVPDLLAHLRATFGPNSTEAYDQRFAKMREAELLVLDDLGAHQSSPWANEKLFQILNYRYNSRFPTIVTANKQGLASIDERILSRLSDTALVTTVSLNGALDYRRQNPRREPMR